ncbi:MAG: hypothetical protein ABI700_15240 [Chloroflexota bacterium]
MAQKSARKTKGQNGVGDSITMFFDVSDPSERRALEASRLLAAKHGRRKAALVAMLDAIYQIYQVTGELPSPAALGLALMGQGSAPGRAPVGFTQAIANEHGLTLNAADVPMPTAQDVPTSKRRAGRRYSGAEVEVTTSVSKDGNDTLTSNFMKSMKGIASGFFD